MPNYPNPLSFLGRMSTQAMMSTVAAMAIVAVSLVFVSQRVEATTPTGGTGGGAISLDTSSTAGAPSWTSLAAIVITEDATTDFAIEGPVTIILSAPAGFQFNTGSVPDVVGSATGDMTSVTTAAGITTSAITITYTVGAQATTDSITVGGVTPIQVQPTNGTPTTGDIFRTGGTGTALPGITNGVTSFGALASVVGAASKLAVTGEPTGSTVAGVAFATQPIVTVQDQHGNTVTGDTSTVSLALTTGTGVLSGTASMAAVAGVADFTGKGMNIDLVGADKVLTASDGGLTTATTAAFTITHAAASQIVITTQPSASTVAGVAFAQQPVAEIRDALGNVATTDSSTVVTATLTTGTGTVSGTVNKTAASGIVDFSSNALKIDLVGADKVLTLDDAGALTLDTTGAFTITVAAASKLAITTQPSASTVAGVAIATQPIVTVQDAFGNTITTDNATVVTLALTTGTGALTGTVTKTAATGIADFAGQGLKIDLVGANKVLTATGGGYTSAATSAFTITNSTATKLAFTTQPSASTVKDVAFATQPIVTVQDAFGNTVVGDTSTVTLALTTGTGTLAGTLTKAAVAGVADFAGQALAIDLVGADKVLTATDGGLTLATTSAFAIVEAAADPVVEPDPVPKTTDGGVTVTVENTETTTTSTTVEVALSTTSSSGSGATVTVPAGALPAGTTLEVSAISNLASLETQARPPTSVDVTLAFSIKATSGGTAVTSGFAEPVKLDFTVDASVVPAGATDGQLRLAFWNGLRWVLVDATVTVNADGTVTVSGTTDHFTLFAVMYNPAGFGVAFERELPTAGVGFVTFGGTTAQLETALVNQSCISPIFVTSGGEWIGFIPTVQFAAVNAAFNALFADGIPLGTPMVATGCND